MTVITQIYYNSNNVKELTLTGHSTTQFQKCKTPTKQLIALLTLMLLTTLQINQFFIVFLLCSVLFNLAAASPLWGGFLWLRQHWKKTPNRVRMEISRCVRNESGNWQSWVRRRGIFWANDRTESDCTTELTTWGRIHPGVCCYQGVLWFRLYLHVKLEKQHICILTESAAPFSSALNRADTERERCVRAGKLLLYLLQAGYTRSTINK